MSQSRSCCAVLAAIFFVVFSPSLRAEVEAVKIRLIAAFPTDLDLLAYTVPEGKVLILEHVIFSDSWGSMQKDIFIFHEGLANGGSGSRTFHRFGASWNQLLRPIRLPSGVAISATAENNTNLRVFLYGKLADEADLFASVDSKIDEVKVSQNRSGKKVEGRIALSSPRPVQVKVETSDDLENWTSDPDASVTTEDKQTKHVAVEVPADQKALYLRADVVARPEEDLPPPPLLPVLPF